MQRYFIALITAFVVLTFAHGASSESSKANPPPWYDETKCSTHDARRADEATDSLKTWDDVYEWFKTFKQCDYHVGEAGENLDDGIARLLANNWDDFSRLAELARKYATFRSFVLSYIGTTADEDDLKKAAINAQQHCPVNEKNLCDSGGTEDYRKREKNKRERSRVTEEINEIGTP
jgi:hypothetical protein